MSTFETIFAEPVELEYIETDAGDVYAFALVSYTGALLSITDDDGNELIGSIGPAEMSRIWDRIVLAREERRAAA